VETGETALKTREAPVVVMADDDDDDCLLARDAFEESGNQGIFLCLENGQELMDYLFGSDILPSLILLDLNMPKKDGRQALKEIKSNPAFQSIPIVVFTTSQEEQDILYAREMGADHFITKPPTFGEWVGVMKMLATHRLNDEHGNGIQVL
jgi:CheY-like chemotaxis protein